MIYSVEYIKSACHRWGIVREAFITSVVVSCLCGLHCRAVDFSGGVLFWVLGKIMVHEYYQDTVPVFCTCIKKVHAYV